MDIFACDVDMFKGMCLIGVSGAATALYAAVLVSCVNGFWTDIMADVLSGEIVSVVLDIGNTNVGEIMRVVTTSALELISTPGSSKETLVLG